MKPLHNCAIAQLHNYTIAQLKMSKTRANDWWCPVCKFTIWGSKPNCFKCGQARPTPVGPAPVPVGPTTNVALEIDQNMHGPYSFLKSDYYGPAIPGEPEGLRYPDCGCTHKMYCPKRHHAPDCKCYTCRCKPHKW